MNTSADRPIDERALSKLRWRCRRGLLENDLFIARLFNRLQHRVSERQARGLLQLMDLSDPDLLDLLLARTLPSGDLAADADAIEVLRLLRAPGDLVPVSLLPFPLPHLQGT